MEDNKKKQKQEFPTIYQKNENCQIFNGPISGCVFAMPGANVTQQAGQPQNPISDEEQELINRLKPVFFGEEKDARNFIISIQGMKPTQITNKVNQLVKEGKISELSKNRDLWKILHDCGIYEKTESNWNSQIK